MGLGIPTGFGSFVTMNPFHLFVHASITTTTQSGGGGGWIPGAVNVYAPGEYGKFWKEVDPDYVENPKERKSVLLIKFETQMQDTEKVVISEYGVRKNPNITVKITDFTSIYKLHVYSVELKDK